MKRLAGTPGMRVALCLAALAASGDGAAQGALPENVYGGIHGRYAPGGDCTRMPRVVAAANGLVVELAEGRETIAAPEVAHAYGGHDYTGSSVWIFPWSGQERPLLFTFNAGEQPGVLEVTAHDHGWSGGTPLAGKFKVLVEASPYATCK